jgi:uncharacterized protein (TIGR02246 family)
MKLAFRVGLIVSLLVACPRPGLAAEDGVRVVDQAWAAAAKAGNVEAIVALYAPDATFYPVGGMDEVKGAAAIRKYYDQWLSQITITDAAIAATYDTVGDLSLGHGTATLSYSPKGGGSPLVVTVRVTAVARRINGKWLYTVDHASVPQK